MSRLQWNRIALLCLLLPAGTLLAADRPPSDLVQIHPKLYPAIGLEWKGESVIDTNWSKICEDPAGRIWFSGGDHWGTDRSVGDPDQRYERPWGFGDTAVNFYDPDKDKVFPAYTINRASALFSNAETPGHGKIHADILCDRDGNIWTGGYLGSSYDHEWTQQFYPKSYPGGAVIRYHPDRDQIEYLGIPNPGGGLVALRWDERRRVIHGITVDRNRYFRLNVDTRELKRFEVARFSGREFIADHEGNVWFPNEFNSLTRFDPDTEAYTDFDVRIPGLRASAVSGRGVIYGISADGMLWSWDTRTHRVEDLGHIVGQAGTRVYTPNMALDERLGRLYFLAGGHGATLEGGMPILTIYDLEEKRFYWAGNVDVDGCYGAVVANDHTVYFSVYAFVQENGRRLKDAEGREYRRAYLLRYEPPRSLEELKQ